MKTGPFLIADDFGLGAGHNAVILDLLEQEKIGGTSVMIDGEVDPASVESLTTCRRNGAQIGLHLNLTHSFGDKNVSAPVGILMRQSLTGTLPSDLDAEFSRQAGLFKACFGFWPDYYDGHQHCHCLPGLARLAARLPRDPETWMRVPLPSSMSGLSRNIRAGGLKTGIIAALAYNARRHFIKAGWPVNADFSGFLRLDDPPQAAHWLPRLISAASDECVVMVHPGSATDPAQCPGHAPETRAVEQKILLGR
ncbi:ChbG/HpnK family deacetylase [Martelella mediterranea]|uniref:Putative glycoside hydrolase/deacetylase ChbG (UPF0249 family) n=1 Tax=Martelella mediterranea TaxID=293089 RepID=A0A4R3NDC6_9HYPH|nr:ChbG/HpnK family deacetylase [Martelella mediterranea]TCT29237.1 putative glycoside hydrolase/deacetylase ChbG (UPF0249 family) [Martelella mediterranea]